MKRGTKLSLTPIKKLKIKYYMKRGKTQGWISRKTGISSGTICHYVNGNYPYRKES